MAEKLDSVYLDKGSFDLKGLKKKIEPLNISKIAKEMGLHHVTAYGYLSLSKRHKKHKVPKIFIDKLLEEVDKLNQSTKEINDKINGNT